MNDDFESKEEGEASVFEGCVLIVIGIIFLIAILGAISDGRITKPITDKLAETIENNPEFFWGDLAKSQDELDRNLLIKISKTRNFDQCVEDELVEYQSSYDVKNENPIIFRWSSSDREIKSLIESEVIPSWPDSITPLNLNHLDAIFEWDRANGMVYIYKILDLMDRNYSKENWSIGITVAEDRCISSIWGIKYCSKTTC
tara:strand:+ start:1965 stop:2567 length:603 start_codon:yes stop_codon:yes gene_type:complete